MLAAATLFTIDQEFLPVWREPLAIHFQERREIPETTGFRSLRGTNGVRLEYRDRRVVFEAGCFPRRTVLDRLRRHPLLDTYGHAERDTTKTGSPP